MGHFPPAHRTSTIMTLLILGGVSSFLVRPLLPFKSLLTRKAVDQFRLNIANALTSLPYAYESFLPIFLISASCFFTISDSSNPQRPKLRLDSPVVTELSNLALLFNSFGILGGSVFNFLVLVKCPLLFSLRSIGLIWRITSIRFRPSLKENTKKNGKYPTMDSQCSK